MRGGFGWGGRWAPNWGAAEVEGYRYVGPCRCGFGPHAYYLGESGRPIHARHVAHFPWQEMPYQSVVSELEQLRREKAKLEARLGEIEKRLGEE